MNVLLTGHGKLGLPLAQRLIARGHRLRVLDVAAPKSAGWPVVLGDHRDPDAVARAVEGCQIVIHNGARYEDRFSLDAHGEFVSTNVLGSANIFAAAVRAGVRHVVFLSSASVLGTGAPTADLDAAGRARRVCDDDPREAFNIYEHSKIAGEQLADYYRRRHGLSVTTLRPAWFPLPGELADHEFAWRLTGPCVWIGDVIAAVLAAIEAPAQGEFLIAAGVPFTDADETDLLARPADVLAKYWPDQTRWWLAQGLPTPPIRWFAEVSPARQRLGYNPTLDFPAAVERMQQGKSPWPTAGLQLAT